EAAQQDHREDPADRDPAELAMDVHAARADQQILAQIERAPSHEDEGMRMDQRRRHEGRSAHQILKREARDDDDRHEDRAANEKAGVVTGRDRNWLCDTCHFLPPSKLWRDQLYGVETADVSPSS